MDLTAKVAALEEEVSVLKGEIKLILQEVRTALLARENPFTVASTESLALPASLREDRGPSTDRGTAASSERELAPPLAAVAEMPVVRPAPKTPVSPSPVTIELQHGRMDVPRLAALVNWTQDTTARHTSADVSIVLSLARYSGLIEGDLEATLAKISRNVTTTERTRASIGDLLLALRQLEAMIGGESSTDAFGRKAA